MLKWSLEAGVLTVCLPLICLNKMNTYLWIPITGFGLSYPTISFPVCMKVQFVRIKMTIINGIFREWQFLCVLQLTCMVIQKGVIWREKVRSYTKLNQSVIEIVIICMHMYNKLFKIV